MRILILLHACVISWLMAPALVRADAPPKPIRVFRVGSSSFMPELLHKTKRIVDATGKFTFDFDERKDASGYTRLDQFAGQPGLYEEWRQQQLPRIEAGKYDFVIFQTIGWLGLTPEQQKKLTTVILPDLAARVRKAGAETILYDKYLPLAYATEKDPRAQKWVLRYPDGQRLNYLLHILAARKSGITKITFGGAAVLEGWRQEPFRSMDYVYCDSGHPGHMASYISACSLSYLMTGIDPVGSPVRRYTFDGWSAKSFNEAPKRGQQAFFDAYKDRLKDGDFELTEAEARALQELAMKHHRQWSAQLKTAIGDDAELARIEAEIARLQADYGKPEAHGMSPQGCETIRKLCAEAEQPGGLSPADLAKIRRKCSTLHSFRGWQALPVELRKAAQKDCIAYWDQNNSKLRDDVLYEAMVYEARMEQEGNREAAAVARTATGILWNIISLPASKIVYDRMPQDKRAEFFATVDGPLKRHAPALTAKLQQARNNPAEFFRIADAYVTIWTDPNLMDNLKEKKFATEVFLEADKEFETRLAGPSPARAP